MAPRRKRVRIAQIELLTHTPSPVGTQQTVGVLQWCASTTAVSLASRGLAVVRSRLFRQVHPLQPWNDQPLLRRDVTNVVIQRKGEWAQINAAATLAGRQHLGIQFG